MASRDDYARSGLLVSGSNEIPDYAKPGYDPTSLEAIRKYTGTAIEAPAATPFGRWWQRSGISPKLLTGDAPRTMSEAESQFRQRVLADALALSRDRDRANQAAQVAAQLHDMPRVSGTTYFSPISDAELAEKTQEDAQRAQNIVGQIRSNKAPANYAPTPYDQFLKELGIQYKNVSDIPADYGSQYGPMSIIPNDYGSQYGSLPGITNAPSRGIGSDAAASRMAAVQAARNIARGSASPIGGSTASTSAPQSQDTGLFQKLFGAKFYDPNYLKGESSAQLENRARDMRSLSGGDDYGANLMTQRALRAAPRPDQDQPQGERRGGMVEQKPTKEALLHKSLEIIHHMLRNR